MFFNGNTISLKDDDDELIILTVSHWRRQNVYFAFLGYWTANMTGSAVRNAKFVTNCWPQLSATHQVFCLFLQNRLKYLLKTSTVVKKQNKIPSLLGGPRIAGVYMPNFFRENLKLVKFVSTASKQRLSVVTLYVSRLPESCERHSQN